MGTQADVDANLSPTFLAGFNRHGHREWLAIAMRLTVHLNVNLRTSHDSTILCSGKHPAGNSVLRCLLEHHPRVGLALIRLLMTEGKRELSNMVEARLV